MTTTIARLVLLQLGVLVCPASLVLAAGPVAAQGARGPVADPLAVAVRAEAWPAAREAAAAQLRKAPADPVAQWITAYACLTAGDYPQASDAFAKLGSPTTGLRLLEWIMAVDQAGRPQPPAVSLLHADALLRSTKASEAISVLDASLVANPRAALLYDLRGVAKAQAADVRGAEADFRSAVAANPALADAQYNLGLLSLEAGEMEKAAGYFTTAIQAAPQYAFPYVGRSLVLAKLGKTADASKDRSAAAALLGARAASYLDRGGDVTPSFRGRGSTLTASPALMFMPGVNSSKPSKKTGHDFEWQDSSQKVAELTQRYPGEFAEPFGATARTGESVKAFEGRLRSYLDKCAAGKKTPFVAMASHLNTEGYAAATLVPLPATQKDKDKDLSWAKQGVPVALRVLAEYGFKTDVLCASWGCSTAQTGLAASDVPAGKLTVIAGRADLSRVEALKSSGHVEELRRITVRGDIPANPRSTAWGPGDIHVVSVTGPGGNTGRDPHNFYYYVERNSQIESRDRSGNVKSDSGSSLFLPSRSTGTSNMSHVQLPPFKESFPAAKPMPNHDEIAASPFTGVRGSVRSDPPRLASTPASSPSGARQSSPFATSAAPASPERGGVLMTAEVVNKTQAKPTSVFGAAPANAEQPEWHVYCPFLAFSAMASDALPADAGSP